MKYLALFFITMLVSIYTKAQLVWDKNRPLTWNDFAGPVDRSSPFSAESRCKVTYAFAVRNSGNNYDVSFKAESLFIPQESWSRPERRSPELLRHEQLHFDISQLYTFRLLKALQSRRYNANYKEEIKTIISTYLKPRVDQIQATTVGSANSQAA
jgi:hypothetical protein